MNMFGGGGGGKPASPPPLPSDPDFFVKNEAFKKQKGASGGGGFGGGGFGGFGGFGSVGMQDMVSPVGTLKKQFGLLKQEIKDVGMQTVRGTVSLKFLGEMMNKLRDLVPLDTIKQLGDSMGAFVGKLNPALVERFNIKFNDLMANIGKPLIPIFQSLIKYTEAWSQVVASMTPVFQPLFDAIKRLVEGEANRLPIMFQRLAPLIEFVVDALAFLVDGFSVLLNVITSMAAYTTVFIDHLKRVGRFIYLLATPFIFLGKVLLNVTGFVIGFIKALLGIGKGGASGPTNSRYDPNKKPETAIRNVEVSGIKSFSDKAFEMSAKNALLTPDEKADPMQNLSYLPDIKAAIERGETLANDIKGIINDVRGYVSRIETEIKGVIPSLSGAVNSATGGLTGFLGRQAMRVF